MEVDPYLEDGPRLVGAAVVLVHISLALQVCDLVLRVRVEGRLLRCALDGAGGLPVAVDVGQHALKAARAIPAADLDHALDVLLEREHHHPREAAEHLQVARAAPLHVAGGGDARDGGVERVHQPELAVVRRDVGQPDLGRLLVRVRDCRVLGLRDAAVCALVPSEPRVLPCHPPPDLGGERAPI